MKWLNWLTTFFDGTSSKKEMLTGQLVAVEHEPLQLLQIADPSWNWTYTKSSQNSKKRG
jgi:hypothetical protein